MLMSVSPRVVSSRSAADLMRAICSCSCNAGRGSRGRGIRQEHNGDKVKIASRLLLSRRQGSLDVVGEPREALEQALARRGARRHDVPDLVLELGQL